ncbi:MAG TPA: GcrA family cell cycle regulator, partial [Sphingomicrobium sp.]
MSWTEERIERLKSMWSEGSTASQIADDLGGVSRNAVIGKAHRLGLEARPSPVKPGEEKESPKKAAKAAAPKTVKAPKAEPPAAAANAADVAPGDAPDGPGPDL